MATFGISGIRYFGNLRKVGGDKTKKIDDLTYVFNICNGLDRKLKDAGHIGAFYLTNDNVWETDLRDPSAGGGGDDNNWADTVDLFFILTHGNNLNGHTTLNYNVEKNRFLGDSSTWRLGNNNDCDWLLMYGCKTIDRNNPFKFWERFMRLHEICGAWGNMVDGFTTDEVGEDVGYNITDGHTIANSWIDGVSDWAVDNHPIVIAAERRSTHNNGNFIWSHTTMNNDHFWGHGVTVSPIDVSEKFWLSFMWAEG